MKNTFKRLETQWLLVDFSHSNGQQLPVFVQSWTSLFSMIALLCTPSFFLPQTMTICRRWALASILCILQYLCGVLCAVPICVWWCAYSSNICVMWCAHCSMYVMMVNYAPFCAVCSVDFQKVLDLCALFHVQHDVELVPFQQKPIGCSIDFQQVLCFVHTKRKWTRKRMRHRFC